MPEPLASALAELRPALLDPDGLVRAIASGRRRGSNVPYRRVELRPVELKAGRRLQVVAYDERQAHTRNAAYGPEAERTVDELLATPFGNWHVETTRGTVQLRVTKKGEAQVHRSARAAAQRLAHDRAKPRLLDPGDELWRAVGIATHDGRVKPSRQDKFRQVEEFLRALEPMLAAVPDLAAPDPAARPVRVVDLGCGNAYLTFAAYQYLTRYRDLPVELVGVDVKRQARERNTKLAAELGWAGRVRFVEGTIRDAPVEGADIVLALHACDTATDEALARAIRWRAQVVLAAPCCHHDLQRQLRQRAAPEPYQLLTRHGILRERFADVLTDALRAAVLRLAGYRVEVVEFVPSEHTPRNVLLRAVRTDAPPTEELVAEYVELTRAWGVRPRLARLLEPVPW